MDPQLLKAINQKIPNFNQRLTKGLATEVSSQIKAYVCQLIRFAEPDFPPGLSFVSLNPLTPVEEYIKATERREAKSHYEISRKDVTMVELVFDYQGVKIEKPLYIPFIREGGLICLRGSTFAVSPVLADKGISIGEDSVFIQIPKSKLTFKRTRHHFIANGVRKTPNVVHSRIHNRNRRPLSKEDSRTLLKMETTLIHYLFAKYGVYKTFSHFNNTIIKIGSETEITKEHYPEKDWVICESIKRKPVKLKNITYEPTDIRLAIRACDFDPISEAMIAGFFYIVDHFSYRIKASYIDDSEDEIRLWRIFLGNIIGGINGGQGNVIEAMNEHMDSLDSYIDEGAKTSLREGEIYADDLYELLYFVIEILSQMVVQSSSVISDMYNKQFVVLRYLLKDINDDIFKLLFKLKKRALKKELTINDVKNIFRGHLRSDCLMKLTDGERHGEICSISSPGDNKFFKITSNIVLQNNSGGHLKKSKGDNVLDKSKFLHASIAEVGSYGVLPKSDPTGRNRVNPWVNINESGSIIRDTKKRELIESTQRIIKRND